MAQEFLTTFHDELKAVILLPSETGGKYCISIDDKIIFDRGELHHFPEIKDLKQTIRDSIAPGKPLGHTDRK